jgi:hypothetical protein
MFSYFQVETRYEFAKVAKIGTPRTRINLAKRFSPESVTDQKRIATIAKLRTQ